MPKNRDVIELFVGLLLVLVLLVVQTVVWIFQLVFALLRLPFALVSYAIRPRSGRTLAA